MADRTQIAHLRVCQSACLMVEPSDIDMASAKDGSSRRASSYPRHAASGAWSWSSSPRVHHTKADSPPAMRLRLRGAQARGGGRRGRLKIQYILAGVVLDISRSQRSDREMASST